MVRPSLEIADCSDLRNRVLALQLLMRFEASKQWLGGIGLPWAMSMSCRRGSALRCARRYGRRLSQLTRYE